MATLTQVVWGLLHEVGKHLLYRRDDDDDKKEHNGNWTILGGVLGNKKKFCFPIRANQVWRSSVEWSELIQAQVPTHAEQTRVERDGRWMAS